jgi:hypothetical protein
MIKLESLKDAFIEQLEKYCVLYKLIGFNKYESPMWFQYRGIKDNEVLFISSQKSQMQFSIPILTDQYITPDQCLATNQAYDYFRNLKYEYIQNNHPTIFKEIFN